MGGGNIALQLVQAMGDTPSAVRAMGGNATAAYAGFCRDLGAAHVIGHAVGAGWARSPMVAGRTRSPT
ncbi:hypothetical protein ACIBQ1_07220 [Nonomuraea sp. NPDC050153]|uniref:hypothetical protein n=1 Tax=Nonomuraea sp. NPDC050153 TaxID=3364359 RepID=UPI0037B063F6